MVDGVKPATFPPASSLFHRRGLERAPCPSHVVKQRPGPGAKPQEGIFSKDIDKVDDEYADFMKVPPPPPTPPPIGQTLTPQEHVGHKHSLFLKLGYFRDHDDGLNT